MDASGLFGDDSEHGSQFKRALSGRQLAICDAVAANAKLAMAALESRSGSRGLVHGDLLLKNILFRADSLAALDFETCGFGCFLYDLAPLLWQLKGDRPADYADLATAMLDGYATLRPDAAQERVHLEAMIAARQLASCRWLLANAHHPTLRQLTPTLLAQRMAELSGYLGSGVLHRRSITL